MSKPLFQDAFSFDTRRSRSSFLLMHVVLLFSIIIMMFPIGAGIAIMMAQIYLWLQYPFLKIIGFILIGGLSFALSITMLLLVTCIAFQRCNDIGISRLWVVALGGGTPYYFLETQTEWTWSKLISTYDVSAWILSLIFVPYVLFFLYLLLMPGQKEPNTFGPNPLAEASQPSAEEQVKPKAVSMTKAKKMAPKKASQKKAAKKTS